MRRRFGIDVFKSQRIGVFEYDLGGHFSLNDVAKNTVRHDKFPSTLTEASILLCDNDPRNPVEILSNFMNPPFRTEQSTDFILHIETNFHHQRPLGLEKFPGFWDQAAIDGYSI